MNSSKSKAVWVVIPAAGVGKRMQSETPKQYLSINNKTIIEHTLDCFRDHLSIAGIIVALNPEDEFWNHLKIRSEKPLYTVEGGEQRSDSVMQALEYLTLIEKAPDDCWVLVHDAARPCLTKKDLDALLAIRENDYVGGLLARPVGDTMKRAIAGENQVLTTEKRDDLWHALTPQLFKIGQLKDALQVCLEKGIEITDESSAIEAVGGHPILVEGSANNIKITHPADLEFAKWQLDQTVGKE